MEDLRQTIGLMRSGGDTTRPLPGVGDVSALINEYRTAGLDVRAEVDETLDDVVGASRLVAHDVVRESLTNCAKHAANGRVDVVVAVSEEHIDVRIENPRDPADGDGRGTGVHGMRQRVEALGGTLAAGSNGPVWIVRAHIPRELDRGTVGPVPAEAVTR